MKRYDALASPVAALNLWLDAVQWRRKMAKPGGANLLNRKYFYGKN